MVPNRKVVTIIPIVNFLVKKDSAIYTDCGSCYIDNINKKSKFMDSDLCPGKNFTHHTTNHSKKEFANRFDSSNNQMKIEV